MKSTWIRVASVLMLIAMLASLVSCVDTGDGQGTDDAGAQTTVGDTTAADTTELNAENLLGVRDFGDKTVTFYSRKYNGVWSSDLMAEDTNGATLNDAIYKRNETICDLYGVKLAEIESGAQSFRTDVERMIKSGDTSFDVLYLGLAEAANIAQSGYLLDMTDIDNINLDGEWWTQSSNEAWSIGNRQYFATGDITTIDDRAIRSMYFNKEMLTNLQLESPYALVENNEWVYEKFFEMVAAADIDDGNGIADLNDTYGVVAQVTFGFMMTMASGEMLVQKDADDIPALAVSENGGRFVDVVDYLTEQISGNSAIYMGADADIMTLFTSGQSLFIAEVLQHAETMRQNYDVNFGIIPMPKYNSSQEDYYQYTTGYCTCVVAFPNNLIGDRLDMASFIVEAMAIESVGTVTPAYYDICLKGRYADDLESGDMLDIITTNVSSDLAEIFSWGGFKTAIQDGISNGQSITSVIKTHKSTTNAFINRAVKAFQDLP